MSRTSTNRRTFLTSAAVAPLILSSSAQGANDRLTMGLIGAGGRGRNVAESFIELGAKFAAVCDVYELNLRKGLETAGVGAEGYGDYEKLLERKDIDAVLIGTPDHWHVPMILDAVQAGKDVYCEKPMSHSISEGVRAVRGVRATDRIVQIGMQRRSTPWIIEAKQMMDDGMFGDVFLVKAQWNWNLAEIRKIWAARDGGRPLDPDAPLEGKLDWKKFVGHAPYRPYQGMRFRNWRSFWDYSGGNMTDQGTHLMDVVQWFTNAGTPRTAVCQGRVFSPGIEAPDVFSAVFDYAGMMATWTLNYHNDFNNGWSIRFEGEKGALVLDEGGYRVYQSPWLENPEPVKVHEDKLPTIPHVRNFLECVKTREQPNAPVEVGHSAVCGPHLANLAYQTKRAAYLNPEATEAF